MSFLELETAAITEIFGNVAHRLSTYEKRGVTNGNAFEGKGVISTQFVRTPPLRQPSSPRAELEGVKRGEDLG